MVRMSISTDDMPAMTRCDECGHENDPRATIPALDGRGRRCADQDECHDRKESRSAFTPA
jgi:hypothetical protein